VKETVLIWRFSSAGDVILTAPAVAALRRAWPMARLVFATKAAYVPVVAANPHLDAVISCAPGWSFGHLRRALAACEPTALCDLHGKARGLLLRLTLPGRRRVVWRKRDVDQTWTMLMGHQRYRARHHIAHRYQHAVEALVGRTLPAEPLRYYVAADDQNTADRLLQRFAGSPRGKRIGISVGAMWATKRWPLQRFAALAAALVRVGHQVILTGSPDEVAAVAEVAAAVPTAVNLAGRLTLGELGGVLAKLDAFVANDSGPMHMARGLCIPTLAFFGSTDPRQFDGTGHRFMFSNRHCAPCSFHGRAACPRGHLGCLTDHTVAAALDHVLTLVAGGPAAPVRG
jgi:heptosyltransferase-2